MNLLRVSASLWLTLFALCLLSVTSFAQSLSYTKGQNISPAYEGWEQAADGTKYFLFGYMNRNWEEEIDVPVGPENGFNIGGADQGQPTHFLPRRNRFVFRVKVPNGFTEKDELIWTLTTHGKTEKAYATLRPDYVVDDVVKASETGALGAGTSSPEVRGNKPPVVHIQEVTARSVKVGDTITLVGDVKDDGIPKRRPPSPAALQRAQAAAAADPIARREVEKSGDVAANPHHRRQEPRSAPVVVRVSRTGWRQGDLRPAAGQGMGGHARRSELAVGAFVDADAVAGRRETAGAGDLLAARHLCASLPRRRRRSRRRRRGNDRRRPLNRDPTFWSRARRPRSRCSRRIGM